MKLDPGAGETGIQRDSAVEQPDGLLEVRAVHLLELLRTEEIELIRAEIVGRLAVGDDPPGFLDQAVAAAEPVGDLHRDLGLNGKYILVGPVPPLRPQTVAGLRVDKLCRDPRAIVLALDGADDDKAGLERHADLARIRRLASVALGRVSTDDLELGKPGEIS